MSEITTIGLDLAKSVFEVHGADASGRVRLRKTLPRAKVLEFFATRRTSPRAAHAQVVERVRSAQRAFAPDSVPHRPAAVDGVRDRDPVPEGEGQQLVSEGRLQFCKHLAVGHGTAVDHVREKP